MHWNFESDQNAFRVAVGNDKYYNDATYNVTYVDSHDYGPDGMSTVRYNRGTQAWAENLNLMFTFRGIPCIYYGSEIEFQKGVVIDKGPEIALANSGRAYYGDHLEGNVNATDFGKYTATGEVNNTLSKPLAKHLIKLNQMRQAIPALSIGQYTTTNVSGEIAFIRRYTDSSTDSFACVSISSGATFKSIPNGTYIDIVTGDIRNVTNGTLSVSSLSGGNMRIYVLQQNGYPSGRIGGTGVYLK
jgi:glycosidase